MKQYIIRHGATTLPRLRQPRYKIAQTATIWQDIIQTTFCQNPTLTPALCNTRLRLDTQPQQTFETLLYLIES